VTRRPGGGARCQRGVWNPFGCGRRRGVPASTSDTFGADGIWADPPADRTGVGVGERAAKQQEAATEAIKRLPFFLRVGTSIKIQPCDVKGEQAARNAYKGPYKGGITQYPTFNHICGAMWY